jgi:DNA invertase Pin-like site-specific DNA recombinase
MAKVKHVFLYCRVSTNLQDTAAQEAELRAYVERRGWVVKEVYRDRMSGASRSRPALDQMMADVRRHRGELAVLVWRFDRFARSVSHLLQALETFRELEVDFVSLSEQVDTATATGKLLFTILGAFSDLERSCIADRVKCGLENARRKGVQLGRPPIRRLTVAEIERVRADRATGRFSLRRLASNYATSVWSIQRAVSTRSREI